MTESEEDKDPSFTTSEFKEIGSKERLLNYPLGGGTVIQPTSPFSGEQEGNQKISGSLSDVEKSEIKANKAKTLFFKIATGLITLAFIALVGWAIKLFSDFSEIKTEINNIKLSVQQLREDKNRDIDRLREDFVIQKNGQNLKNE